MAGPSLSSGRQRGSRSCGDVCSGPTDGWWIRRTREEGGERMVNPLSRAALETRGILDHVVCNARARLGANNRKIKGGREASEEWLSIHASQ